MFFCWAYVNSIEENDVRKLTGAKYAVGYSDGTECIAYRIVAVRSKNPQEEVIAAPNICRPRKCDIPTVTRTPVFIRG